MAPKIRIRYLYPELLNLYGDRGNLLVLVRRAAWRGMEVEVENASIGNRLDPGLTTLSSWAEGRIRSRRW